MKKTTWGNYLKRSFFIYHSMNVGLQVCSDPKYADPKSGMKMAGSRMGCKFFERAQKASSVHK